MIFSDKTAIVTGGAGGIGSCITHHLLDAGAYVIIIDIIAAKEHERLSHFQGDIADKATLEAFVTTLPHPVDLLINNACIGRGGLLSGCSYEDFEYVQKVGVTAPYYLTNLLLQQGLLASGAAIVNIASTRANQSKPNTEAYTAAKGGIVALTHAMAASLAGRARVNAISPGWIETSHHHHTASDIHQHPAGRVGTADDIALMVLHLCDNEKSGFITGQNFVIDGGMSKLMIYHNDHGWNYTNMT
ncbi:MAG: SDR family oxidoreductase [Defluviitaleaceae bacterium]|nr:SDR family oxidoreductase [Defluviitaleaceae bacterium]